MRLPLNVITGGDRVKNETRDDIETPQNNPWTPDEICEDLTDPKMFPDNTPIPPGFEPGLIRNFRNGGMDVTFTIAQPEEWMEKYPDAFKEVRDDVLGEFGGVFEIRESNLRRLMEEIGFPATEPEQDAGVGETARTRRKEPEGDLLTMTVEEAAEQLGISRALGYEAVRRREIPSIKIGRRILIPKAALKRMLEMADSN